MSFPILGTITLSAINFAPRGFMYCAGQLMSIQQYSALYALLGVTFGGNPQSNFNLPDLQGRVPIGVGTGAGLSTYVMGQKAGSQQVTLSLAQMPVHNHNATATTNVTMALNAANATANSTTVAAGAYLANGLAGSPSYTTKTYLTNPTTPPATVALAGASATAATNVSVANNGAGQAVSLIQPVLALQFLIAIEGVFPMRN